MDLFSASHPVTTDVDISSQAFWDRPFNDRDDVFQSKYGVAMAPTRADQATAAAFFLTMDTPEHGICQPSIARRHCR